MINPQKSIRNPRPINISAVDFKSAMWRKGRDMSLFWHGIRPDSALDSQDVANPLRKIWWNPHVHFIVPFCADFRCGFCVNMPYWFLLNDIKQRSWKSWGADTRSIFCKYNSPLRNHFHLYPSFSGGLIIRCLSILGDHTWWWQHNVQFGAPQAMTFICQGMLGVVVPQHLESLRWQSYKSGFCHVIYDILYIVTLFHPPAPDIRCLGGFVRTQRTFCDSDIRKSGTLSFPRSYRNLFHLVTVQ